MGCAQVLVLHARTIVVVMVMMIMDIVRAVAHLLLLLLLLSVVVTLRLLYAVVILCRSREIQSNVAVIASHLVVRNYRYT